MQQKGFVSLIIILLVVAGIIAAAAVALYPQLQNKILTTSPTPAAIASPTPAATPQASPATEQSAIPAGWLTYKSDKYGFIISYPSTYKALDDKENLYGWPDAIVLLYKGGQAYDIAIEAWDTEAEYKSKYSSQMTNLTVYKIGSKFITILNSTNEQENAQIISTFKATK